ncbi:unnamed protein product, partial [Rotaria sp. Silwood1]
DIGPNNDCGDDGDSRRGGFRHDAGQATYDNPCEAEASIENQWSKHYTNYTEQGRKVYYRCKRRKRRDPQ